jgi:hypothetical protein
MLLLCKNIFLTINGHIWVRAGVQSPAQPLVFSAVDGGAANLLVERAVGHLGVAAP